MSKIVLINSVYAEKSTGNLCKNIANRLMQEGHEVYCFYGRGKNKKETNSKKIGNVFTFGKSLIEARFFDSDGFNSVKETKKLIRYIDQIKPDIVHLHNLHGYYINAELLLWHLKIYGIRTIVTLHDSWLYTGHCCYYLSNQCYKWKEGCHNCEFKNEYPRCIGTSNSESNLIKKKNFCEGFTNLSFICPSVWLKDEVKQSFLGKYPVYVVHNGINLKAFNSVGDELIRDQKIKILGANAVWDRRKNIDAFLHLAKNLDSNYEITLVGRIDKPSLFKLKQLSNVKLIPFVSSLSKLKELYRSSDLFINPTLDDNYPTTSLESIACGTPVICFNSGGASETVPNGCGEVIPVDNNLLLEKVKTFKKYRIAENESLQKFLSSERYCDEMMEIYNKVLHG